MRYEVYKLANVDSIKDVDLLNKFWSILLNAGMRLSGQEVLLYAVDTRGEVNVFVNPNPTSVKECVLAFNGPEDEGKEVSISDTEYEIVAPAYIEMFISDYTRVIRCTDELSDDELNALSFDHTKNNFAKIRHSKKPAAPFQIRKVEDLEDVRIREKCRVAINGHDSVDESLYLISNDEHWYVAKISEMICLDNFD